MTTREELISYLESWGNEYECDECPYNDGFDRGASGNCLPCGQYRCWVTIHMTRYEKD